MLRAEIAAGNGNRVTNTEEADNPTDPNQTGVNPSDVDGDESGNASAAASDHYGKDHVGKDKSRFIELDRLAKEGSDARAADPAFPPYRDVDEMIDGFELVQFVDHEHEVREMVLPANHKHPLAEVGMGVEFAAYGNGPAYGRIEQCRPEAAIVRTCEGQWFYCPWDSIQLTSPRPANTPATPAPATNPANGNEWEVVDVFGLEYGKRLPRQRIPAICRIGNAVEFDEDASVHTAKVVGVRADVCICELPDGTTRDVPWRCIRLEDVRPDPSQVTE